MTTSETESVRFAGPLDARDLDTVAAFRAMLDTHGFATNAVWTALGGPLRSDSHLRVDLPLYLRRLSGPAPINTLIKLFVLDQSIEEGDVRRAVAPLELRDVRSLGLVEETPGKGVRARVRLSGYRNLVLAHDRYDEQLGELRPDHVLDVNPTSVTLTNLTVRRHGRTALDVGTGSGVLALLAAEHTDRVIATDTNERALNMAAFNARLNGVENVEWRLGSLFEPVVGRRFDLIVCNPPYVISPDSNYAFRDSGRRGDAICAEIAGRLPHHLEDGGFASMLCNWALEREEEWSSPLRRWIGGCGCDAWLFRSKTLDPLTYAAFWNRTPKRERYEQALDRWTAYCRTLGIASIGMGAIVLRRTAREQTWVRADDLPDGDVEACGPQIERIFQAEDYLASIRSEAVLLGRAFIPAGDLRLTQTLGPSGDGYEPVMTEIQLTGGFRTRGTADAYTVRLLARCDGQRTIGEIATELAAHSGPVGDRMASAAAAVAKRLVAAGILIPVIRPNETERAS